MDWESLREREFPVASRWAYLDHAAMCPLPRPTAEAVRNWLDEAIDSGSPVWGQWVRKMEVTRSTAAQMIGGYSIRQVRKVASSRTGVLITQIVVGALALVGVGLAERLEIPIGFWVAIALLTLFSLLSAVAFPIQQAFMNGCIPSEQRATVLSFASLMGSAGGVVAQPALGRVADVYSYGVAYVVAGVVYVLSLPFLIAVRRMGLSADRVTGGETAVAALRLAS